MVKNREVSLRTTLWQQYTDCPDLLNNPCFCCPKLVSAFEFEVGHILADSKGGERTIQNCRPICRACNGQCSNKEMFEWMSTVGYKRQYCLSDKCLSIANCGWYCSDHEDELRRTPENDPNLSNWLNMKSRRESKSAIVSATMSVMNNGRMSSPITSVVPTIASSLPQQPKLQKPKQISPLPKTTEIPITSSCSQSQTLQQTLSVLSVPEAQLHIAPTSKPILTSSPEIATLVPEKRYSPNPDVIGVYVNGYLKGYIRRPPTCEEIRMELKQIAGYKYTEALYTVGDKAYKINVTYNESLLNNLFDMFDESNIIPWFRNTLMCKIGTLNYVGSTFISLLSCSNDEFEVMFNNQRNFCFGMCYFYVIPSEQDLQDLLLLKEQGVGGIYDLSVLRRDNMQINDDMVNSYYCREFFPDRGKQHALFIKDNNSNIMQLVENNSLLPKDKYVCFFYSERYHSTDQLFEIWALIHDMLNVPILSENIFMPPVNVDTIIDTLNSNKLRGYKTEISYKITLIILPPKKTIN